MNNRLDNKGFTLVELLAVLVILVAIMGIAIPSISSSLERTKDKQNDARLEIIKSAAEMYVTDHKNAVYGNLDEQGKCYFNINDDSNDDSNDYLSYYLSKDERKDVDGNPFKGYVNFDKQANSYTYDATQKEGNPCVEEGE